MDQQPRVNPYIAGRPITGTEMFYGRAEYSLSSSGT